MTNLGNGVYSTEVLLPELSYQTYRFINGNSFESGLENVPEDCGVDDGFGGMKRYMTVPEGGHNSRPCLFWTLQSVPPRIA